MVFYVQEEWVMHGVIPELDHIYHVWDHLQVGTCRIQAVAHTDISR